MTIVKAGTLDDGSNLKPQSNVWCTSAQPWATLDAAQPQFEGNAPAPRA